MSITPYLLYEDVASALEWLAKAFGFEETLRFTGEEGYVSHAEMRLGDATFMLGDPGGDYKSPKRLGQVTQLVHVDVDDVGAHHERAKAAGAEIRQPPKDEPYGDRRYDCTDLEGHLWSFAQRVHEVQPEEWGAEVSARG